MIDRLLAQYIALILAQRLLSIRDTMDAFLVGFKSYGKVMKTEEVLALLAGEQESL